MSSKSSHEQIIELAEDELSRGAVESIDEALYVVLMEAARCYLAAVDKVVNPNKPADQVGFSSASLWSTVQSMHENLIYEAYDYDDRYQGKTMPDEPTLAVIRKLSQLPAISVSRATPDMFAMAKCDVVHNGMLFFDLMKRSRKTAVIRLNVEKYESGDVSRITWEHISDDGTRLQGPFSSPSKASLAIRGTVTNSFDTWRATDGRTLRQIYLDWKNPPEDAS